MRGRLRPGVVPGSDAHHIHVTVLTVLADGLLPIVEIAGKDYSVSRRQTPAAAPAASPTRIRVDLYAADQLDELREILANDGDVDVPWVNPHTDQAMMMQWNGSAWVTDAVLLD